MIFEKRDEFETLFQNLLHFIKQEIKFVERLEAILQQDSALFDLLKQKNWRLYYSTV